MRGQWRPTAPAVKYDKGTFSFLIAFGRQLELALELESEGSAPEFVSDALGVLENGLEGLTIHGVDVEDETGGPDEGSEAGDDGPPWVETQVGGNGPRTNRRPGTMGGTVRGTRPLIPMESRHVQPPVVPFDVTPQRGGKKVKRGKKQTKK